MIKLEVSTHGGDVDVVDADEYNPEVLEAKLNDSDIHSIAIGENIYSRIDIKNIRPVDK